MVRWPKPPNAINHDGHELPYELLRRPRVTRNMYLELADDGSLKVVAPKHMSARAVHRALQRKSQAVMDFLLRKREDRHKRPVYSYAAGEQHLFLGQWYPLQHSRERAAGPFDGVCIAVTARGGGYEELREALRRWYREQAGAHFQQRLEHFCALAPWTGGDVPPLRLRRMKRSAGSCSRAGVITMNPHLVKAPPQLVDYVLAHEVCHLREHNHGKGFYRLLDGLYPDWRHARMHLRENWHIFLAE